MRSHAISMIAISLCMFQGLAHAQERPAPDPSASPRPGARRDDVPSGFTFLFRTDLSAQAASNINLAPAGAEQIDAVGIEVAPGFSSTYSSDSFSGVVDYSYLARYWDRSELQDDSHRLAANGEWLAVPEWFSVGAQANFGETVVDPLRGQDYRSNGVFANDNLAGVGAASIRPNLRHRFGMFELDANYTYGRVWYEKTAGAQSGTLLAKRDRDSVDKSARVTLATADSQARLFGKIYYDWQRSDYQNEQPFEYELAGVTAGYRFARTLALVGEFGRETRIDLTQTADSFASDFWSGGLRWAPSQRTSAEVRVGERFFGQTYFVKMAYAGRILNMFANYTEEPTQESRLFSMREYEPGELPEVLPGGLISRFNTAAFINNVADIGITANGSRTSLGLRAYSQRREYLTTVGEFEDSKGADVSLTRRLAPTSTLTFAVSMQRYETNTLTFNTVVNNLGRYTDLQYTLSFARRPSANLTLSGETAFLQRSGNVDYDGWWIALRARWAMRPGAN